MGHGTRARSGPGAGGLVRLFPLGIWWIWLALAWPPAAFFRAVPAGEDTLEVMWALAWYRRALFHLHVSPLFHPLAFAPAGWHVAKQHHGPFLIGLMLPWALLGGDAFAYHLMGWTTLTLAFGGMFRLAGLFTRDRWAATAAGVAYALFNGAWAAMRIYGDYLAVAWGCAALPWMAYALERARRSGWKAGRLALAGGIWGLGIAGSPYLLPLGGVMALAYGWGAWRRRRLRAFLGSVVGIALLLGGPWIALFLDAVRQDGLLGQTLGTALGNGYPWADAWVWNPNHLGRRGEGSSPGRPIFSLGAIPTVSSLAGVALAAAGRRRLRSRRLLSIAVGGALLATGLAVKGAEPIRFPWPPALAAIYEAMWRIGHARKPDLFPTPTLPPDWSGMALTPALLLWAVLPFWEAAGTVWRFIALTALGLLVAGAEAWTRGAGPGIRRPLFALWLLEAAMAPLPMLPWPYAVHPAFEWLRDHPEPGAVVDAFADHTPGLHLSRVVVMATEYHRRPTLAGFPPFHPRWLEALQRGRGVLFRHRPDGLGRYGFRFLVVHNPPVDWRKWNWPFPLERCFDPPPMPSPWDYPICVFRIPDRGEPDFTNLWLLDGWSAPESWGVWAEGLTARALWPAREAGHLARLRLRAFPFCVPGQVQRIAVVFNGRPLGEGAFPDCGEHEIGWAIPGAWVRRMNEFVFRFAYAAVPPRGDLRRLAVGVRALEVEEGPIWDNMGGEGSLLRNPSSR